MLIRVTQHRFGHVTFRPVGQRRFVTMTVLLQGQVAIESFLKDVAPTVGKDLDDGRVVHARLKEDLVGGYFGEEYVWRGGVWQEKV